MSIFIYLCLRKKNMNNKQSALVACDYFIGWNFYKLFFNPPKRNSALYLKII